MKSKCTSGKNLRDYLRLSNPFRPNQRFDFPKQQSSESPSEKRCCDPLWAWFQGADVSASDLCSQALCILPQSLPVFLTPCIRASLDPAHIQPTSRKAEITHHLVWISIPIFPLFMKKICPLLGGFLGTSHEYDQKEGFKRKPQNHTRKAFTHLLQT